LFSAARRIQAWWRGVQTRQYIIFLHKSSCVVQAAYRAFKGRNQYQKVIQEAVDKMRNGYYAKMATRIQSRWRGYFTRKYKHNYYARKDYLQVKLRIQ
jgi:myosin heavy subunit